MVSIKSIHYTEKSLEFSFVDETSNERNVGVAKSEITQSTLIAAFLGGMLLDIELEDDSNEIKRLLPFGVSRISSRNLEADYGVSRIATQRVRGVGDHLEVFITKRIDPAFEVVYNVSEPALQRLLIGSFLFSSVDKFNLYLIIEDKIIKSAGIGKS